MRNDVIKLAPSILPADFTRFRKPDAETEQPGARGAVDEATVRLLVASRGKRTCS
jgi:hypothetical protein